MLPQGIGLLITNEHCLIRVISTYLLFLVQFFKHYPCDASCSAEAHSWSAMWTIEMLSCCLDPNLSKWLRFLQCKFTGILGWKESLHGSHPIAEFVLMWTA
jgi:hypothetical protein